jgi:hypothetical protein
MSRAADGLRAATSAPATTNPTTWASCRVMLVRDVATAYRSPSSTSAMSADRADSNGGEPSETRNSRTSIAGSGIPGMAMPASSTARAASVATRTRWRGRRSANAESSGPPSSHGR